MADAIVSQDVVEVLATGEADAVISQDVVEVLATGEADAVVSQNVVEVLATGEADAVISHYVVEILTLISIDGVTITVPTIEAEGTVGAPAIVGVGQMSFTVPAVAGVGTSNSLPIENWPTVFLRSAQLKPMWKLLRYDAKYRTE